MLLNQSHSPGATLPRAFFSPVFAILIYVWFIVTNSFAGEPAVWRVRAGDRLFEVEVVADSEGRRKGLMGRQSLPDGRGLLMVLPRPTAAGVWMKNMQFALDVVWLDAGGRVIERAMLQPCRQPECPIYWPNQPASYILEIGAGKFPLSTGEIVEIMYPSGDSLTPLGGQ